MVQWLKVLAALPEDLSLILSIHMADHNHDSMPSSDLHECQVCTWCPDIHTKHPYIYIK